MTPVIDVFTDIDKRKGSNMRTHTILKFFLPTLTLMLLGSSSTQSQYLELPVMAPPLADEQLIRLHLTQCERLFRAGTPEKASFIFSTDARSRKSKPGILDREFVDINTFYIEVKSLVLRENTADALCVINSMGFEKAKVDSITFTKKDGQWAITTSDVLLPIARAASSKSSLFKAEPTGGGSTQLNPINVVYSDKVLIRKHLYTDLANNRVYKLTRTHVQNQLRKWLLAYPVEMVMKVFSFSLTDFVIFALDHMWDRIIISESSDLAPDFRT